MELTRTAILRLAWPIILANAAAPLLGLADTAVVGNVGTVADLGAIALAAQIFSFVYWSFGFLRMGTSGFAAQAAGAGDEAEVRATLGRALVLATLFGALLLLFHVPIGALALRLLDGSAEVEDIARTYFDIRIWGAPAALASYAVNGTLIGLGKSRALLGVQIFLNVVNIVLDVVFAGVLDMGAAGIALGTAIAEWAALIVSVVVVIQILRARRGDAEPFWPTARIRDPAKILRTLSANRDILVRTLFLVFGFVWFVNESARYGDTVLAANHILMQFVGFSAFFLDGYAFAVESLIGHAIGGRDASRFDLAVRRSTELAAGTAVLLALGILVLGPIAIATMTDLEPIRARAGELLPYAALYVVLAFPAFQLDGIFIGATRTRQMRNAAGVSVAAFLGAWWLLADRFGEDGLWLAFIVYVVARAVTLLAAYPSLRTSLHRERSMS